MNINTQFKLTIFAIGIMMIIFMALPFVINAPSEDAISLRYGGHIEKLNHNSFLEIEGVVTDTFIVYENALYPKIGDSFIEINSSGKYYLMHVSQDDYEYLTIGDSITIPPTRQLTGAGSVYRIRE